MPSTPERYVGPTTALNKRCMQTLLAKTKSETYRPTVVSQGPDSAGTKSESARHPPRLLKLRMVEQLAENVGCEP